MARLLLTLLLLGSLTGCPSSSERAEGPEPAPEAPAAPQPEPAGPRVEQAPSPERTRAMRACQNGDAQACFRLAEMLERGEGGPADPDRARAMYEEACAAGSYEACDAMGH